MSLRLLRFCSVPAPAVLVVSLLWSCSGRAADPQRGRPIEFSDPKSTEIATNLNQLSSRRGGLRELEEDLYKPLLSFSPESSLDGVVAPPVRSAPGPRIQSKKVRQLLEAQRNWFLSNPEDLTTGPTVEEIFNLPEYGPDGKEKKKQPSVENYYERLDQERRSDRGTLKKDELLEARRRSDSLDDLKAQDDATLPGGLTDQERTLRRLFDSQPGRTVAAPDSGRGSFSDVFGLGNNNPSREEVEAHKITLKQFEQLFSSSPGPIPGTDLQSSLSGLSGARTAPAASGLDTLPASTRSTGFEATLGTINTPLGVSGLQDFGAKGFNQWTPAAAPPRVDMPNVPRPPSVLDFPQRKF